MAQLTTSVADHLILPAAVRLPPKHEELLRNMGRTVPTPFPIRLVIDTGSKRTTLVPGVFRHLQAVARGSARIFTALGAIVTTNLFWVSIEFPEAGLATFPEILVARLPLPPRLVQFHGLADRDLLRRFESFEYEGRRGRYTLRDKPGMFDWLRRRL